MQVVTDVRRVLTASAIAFSYGVAVAILFFVIGGSSQMLPISSVVIFALTALQGVVAALRQRAALGILALLVFCVVGVALYLSLTHLQTFLAERHIAGGYVLNWVT